MTSDVVLAIFLLVVLEARTCCCKPCGYYRLSLGHSSSRCNYNRELEATADRNGLATNCSTGLQLADAFADGRITSIVLTSDIILRDVDWTNRASPLRITRNITVTGVNPDREKWIICDFAYVKNKIQLASGMYITFRFVVLNHWREDPHFMAPGMDILAPGPILNASDQSVSWPAVVIDNSALIHRTCVPIPEKMTTASETSYVRPIGFPGNQSGNIVSQPACDQHQHQTNDAADVHPMQRCWPLAGLREEFITYAFNLDSSGRQVQAGYLVFVLHSDYLCETVMSTNCSWEYTAVGCYWHMFPHTNGSSSNSSGGGSAGGGISPAVLLAPTTPLAERGPSSPSSALTYVLGGALGGTFAVVCILVAALSLHHWYYHVRRCKQQQIMEGASLPCSSTKFCNNVFFTEDNSTASQQGGCDVKRVAQRHGCYRGEAEAAVDLEGQVNALSSTILQPERGNHDENGLRDTVHRYGLGLLQMESGKALAPNRSSLSAQQQGSVGFAGTADLDPVTSLTPLHPDIKLNIKVDNQDVKLSNITLGKGAFGRVVKGTYDGVPVAVKIIDQGFWSILKPHQSAGLASKGFGTFPQEACYMSTNLPIDRGPAAGQIEISRSGGGSDTQQQATTNSAAGTSPLICRDADEESPSGKNKGGADRDSHMASRCSEEYAGVTDARKGTRKNGRTGGSCHTMISDGKAADNVIISNKAAGASINSASVSLDGGEREFDDDTLEPHICAKERRKSPDNGYVGTINTVEVYQPEVITYNMEAFQEPQVLNSIEASLKQEVEILARCQHPNIVRLLAACLSPPRICLIMELMESSLDQLLYGESNRVQQRPLPLNMILHITTQIAQGLAYLHPTIVHRDLKPGNVLLSRTDTCHPIVKLADFGLSRLRETVIVTKHTEVGTAAYVAPEAFDTSNFIITDRVDIYALGIILWEMLASQRPWAGQNMVVIAFAVAMNGQRPPLECLSKERCPLKLRTLIQSCWDEIPARRPAAADVVKWLALVQESVMVGTNRCQ